MSDPLMTAREALVFISREHLETLVAWSKFDRKAPTRHRDAIDAAEAALATLNATPASSAGVPSREAIEDLYDEHHGLPCPLEADPASWGRGANSGWDAAIKRIRALYPTPAVAGEREGGQDSVGMKPSPSDETGGVPKFTPGPWHVDGHRVFGSGGAFLASAWYPRAANDARQDGESWLAMRERTQAVRDAIERETVANARLIAAAPDLYEALETAAEVFNVYAQLHAEKGTTDGDRKAEANRAHAKRCEAALAKAQHAASVAPEARATAQTRLSAEGAHEGCEATEKPTGPSVVPLSAIGEGWQPIETAPKDKHILSFHPGWGPVEVNWEWGDDEDYEGWIATHADQDFSPTHWMPLPAPPAPSEGGE